jgi:hypothetical protein
MKRNGLVLAAAVLAAVFLATVSCTSKEEKTYGKILPKDKNQREVIEFVQNAVFNYNKNLSLKEAVAQNYYSRNITWDLKPGDRKGDIIVFFTYDVSYDGVVNVDSHDMKLTVVGESNYVARLLSDTYGILNMNYFEYGEETARELVKQYLAVLKKMTEENGKRPEHWATTDRFPDDYRKWNKPFFYITRGQFIGEVNYSPGDDTLEFGYCTMRVFFKAPEADIGLDKDTEMYVDKVDILYLANNSPGINILYNDEGFADFDAPELD